MSVRVGRKFKRRFFETVCRALLADGYAVPVSKAA